MAESAEERKRKRLEAWRRRKQQQGESASPPAPPPPPKPVVKVSLSLNANKNKAIKRKPNPAPPPKPINPFGGVDDDSDESDTEGPRRGKLSLGLGFSLTDEKDEKAEAKSKEKKRKRGRWDAGPEGEERKGKARKRFSSGKESVSVDDTLDKFMDKLEAGALGSVTTQVSNSDGTKALSIDVGGSVMRPPKVSKSQPSPVSGGVITPEQLAMLSPSSSSKDVVPRDKEKSPDALYTNSDWESDAQGGGASEVRQSSLKICLLVENFKPKTKNFTSSLQAETDTEEEKARRAFIEALKSAPGPQGEQQPEPETVEEPRTAADVRSEKQRREQRLRELEREAEEARGLAEAAAAPELGRLYNDVEGGVMEEAERNLDAAMAAPDALQVLAELNKKKELKAVDHSKVEYIDFKKNLYIVPRVLAKLSSDDVANLRGKLKVKVRGHGAPAPVSSFEQCGLSERILQVMEKQEITTPFPVQAQCLPCIMAGRDVIGIAKTGSGKTLGYLLPMLRHIMDQPPLAAGESGPIGLVLAPARELAYQIHIVCKGFTKQLGLK